MMFRILLKKIGVFFLSLVFGLWTLFVALSIPVRADSLAWGLDLVGSGNPVVDLLAAYDIIPILSAGGSIELAKFNTYDEWKEWWIDEMTARIAAPSDIQESLQAGVDAYRVAGVSSLSDQDSLFAKVNQRYLAMQIGYAKDFVDRVSVLSDPVATPAPEPDFSSLVTYISSYQMSASDDRNWSSASFMKSSSFNWSSEASKSLPFSVFMPNGLSSIQNSSVGNSSSSFYTSDVATIYLNKDSGADTYSAVYIAPYKATFNKDGAFNGAYGVRFYWDMNAFRVLCPPYNLYNSSTPFSSAQTSFAGKSTAINYVYQHFRHVNLYVDGIPWIFLNPPVPEPDPVSFPDVIRTGDGDFAYDLVVPDTDSGYAYFDLTALLSRIYDMINDTSSTADKTLTFEDVQDLLVDKEGTQVSTKSVVVSKVIADSLDITGSPPSPSGFPDYSFDHPVLYFPPVDSGSGSSILAELIHATDVSLPDDLMLAVWGALGCLFVLGVIHILHK